MLRHSFQTRTHHVVSRPVNVGVKQRRKLNSRSSLTATTLKGVYAPLPTPFTTTGKLSIEDVKYNVKYWYNNTRLQGYVVMGSSGEFSSLTFDEKVELLAAVKDAADPSKQLIAGTGSCSKEETLKLTDIAHSLGYSAAMVIPPYYFLSKLDDDALHAYYTSLADESPLPIILYNMPSFAGINITTKLATQLSNHPNIIGIKDSGGSLEQLWKIVHNANPEGFSVVAGSGSTFLPALMYGASGGIMALANVIPGDCITIYEHYMENKLPEAMKLQTRVVELNHCITTELGIPGMKYILNKMGLRLGGARLPLKPLTAVQKQRVDDLMATYQLPRSS